tara:strand:- start:588 stop:818 length:231 start_codon:yes stop_codon:yes gene_type:complete
MQLSLAVFRRIAKKLRRRTRFKGTTSLMMHKPFRNFSGPTAVKLWEAAFNYREVPAARAGAKRQAARLAAQKRKRS